MPRGGSFPASLVAPPPGIRYGSGMQAEGEVARIAGAARRIP